VAFALRIGVDGTSLGGCASCGVVLGDGSPSSVLMDLEVVFTAYFVDAVGHVLAFLTA